MIINRRNQSGASSPGTAVTDADAAVMNAAIVAALRRRNTPPGNFLKTNEENTAFSPANAAAKNVHSSLQEAAARNRPIDVKVRLRWAKRRKTRTPAQMDVDEGNPK